MNAIEELKRFNTERGLHYKVFSLGSYLINDAEETGELVEAYRNSNEPEIVDAICDKIVFAIGELLKLGYDPEIALLETAKEINSRVGEFKNGKFHKDKSPEAQANWYKANYGKARK